MNISSSSSSSAAAAAAAATSVKLREDEFARLTHDDFVALHASRHNERQFPVPSLRIKCSIYSAVILCLCAFTLKTLVSSSNAIMRGEYAKDRHVATATDQLLNLTVVNESNLSRVQQRWNSSSSSSSQNEVSMSIDSKASRHIWIDVISYTEGIAGWKTSLLELLHLAQALNATLVEPCMTSGRLGSCGDQFNIPVSDLFDLAEYMVPSIGKRHPELVSYDKYQAALGHSYLDTGMVKLCLLNDMRLNIDNRCSTETTHIRDMGQNDLMHILDKANEDNFILHMEDYWRGSLNKLGKRLGMEFPDSKEFDSKILPFHSRHLQYVDDLLQRGNITSNNFSAIHWRAEKAGMNYTRCARAVNNVKHIMLKRNTSSNNITEAGEESRHKFVLLSSLNEDSDKMWLGSRRTSDKSSIRKALRYLLHDNGFVKIDDLLEKEHKLRDSGMLAIYDLIIAAKAFNFASCARYGEIGCTEASRSLCEECNHVGKFGRMATLFRQEKSSLECWPTE